ncbi:polymeric immunoglobulin receptor-like [Pseudophryne corroboree]|uniref:polymeric immunoglobulin receptor-like n=1 Tax=Pseudophryne corroboree TaxID=495146 RepID=UPI00308180C7
MMTKLMILFGLIYVFIIHNVESSGLVCPKQATGIVGGSVTFTCMYSTSIKANLHTRKFMCLQGGQHKRCKSVIVSTSRYVDQRFLGRAEILDGKDGTLTITLSDLQKTDEGNYVCGIGQSNDGIMDDISVAVTEDSVIPTEPKLVYVQLRGTVKLRCEFGDQNTANRKYLCKILQTGCKNIIDNTGEIAAEYQGRILLQTDERNPGSFTVTIIQLKNEDSGHYSCGLGHYGEPGDISNFDLRINEDTDIPQGSKSLSSRLGGSVTALCKYNPKKNYTGKFWCKLEDTVCNPIITTDGYVLENYEGRVVIHDNPTNGTMQFIMNQINKEDEGWYWCVLTDGKHDQTSTVELSISEGNLEGLNGNKIIEVTAGETAKITCSYPCRFKPYEKYLCRWSNFGCERVTSQDDDQNGLSITCETHHLVRTIDSVSQKDSGWYWCGVKKSDRYGETIAVQLIVTEKNIEHSDPIESRANIVNNRNNQVIVTPPSNDNSKNGTIVAAIISVCAAVLVVTAVIVIFRLRKRKNSDLVSVGSYRTNISMSDLDNVIGKDNPAVIQTQETDISKSKEGPKINKKGSQEDLDYSSFLIHDIGSPNEDLTS